MVIPVLLGVLVALVVGAVVGLLVSQRLSVDAGTGGRSRSGDPGGEAVVEALEQLRREQSQQLQGLIDTTLSVASSKLGDQLAAGKQVMDRERLAVAEQVAGVQGELQRVSELVASLQRQRAEQDGRLVERLDRTMAETHRLAETTTSLRDALASPKSRGQWGERMAEDVLRLAGFIDGVNYTKQQTVPGGGVPDYTFRLPKGHVIHMDVKFPVDNYLRWLEADSDAGREQFARQFKRDVRHRVKELTDRSYIDPERTVDYLLLFIPNESVYGFVHEHDPDLIDLALGQKVVLCSPTSLFAVLAVIRQAVDNFLVEQRSTEILASISGLREQWDRFGASVEKMGRGLQSAQKAYDDLAGPRSRQFEKQIEKLETVRASRQPAAVSDRSASGEGGEADDDRGRHWLALAQ